MNGLSSYVCAALFIFLFDKCPFVFFEAAKEIAKRRSEDAKIL